MGNSAAGLNQVQGVPGCRCYEGCWNLGGAGHVDGGESRIDVSTKKTKAFTRVFVKDEVFGDGDDDDLGSILNIYTRAAEDGLWNEAEDRPPSDFPMNGPEDDSRCPRRNTDPDNWRLNPRIAQALRELPKGAAARGVEPQGPEREALPEKEASTDLVAGAKPSDSKAAENTESGSLSDGELLVTPRGAEGLVGPLEPHATLQEGAEHGSHSRRPEETESAERLLEESPVFGPLEVVHEVEEVESRHIEAGFLLGTAAHHSETEVRLHHISELASGTITPVEEEEEGAHEVSAAMRTERITSRSMSPPCEAEPPASEQAPAEGKSRRRRKGGTGKGTGQRQKDELLIW